MVVMPHRFFYCSRPPHFFQNSVIGTAMKQNKQPYIKWYSSDFLAGVRGMTATQIGVYTILINEMYERCEPLPLDHRRLAWQCGCTKPTLKKVLDSLIQDGKIEIKNDGLWNFRVEKEFISRQKRVATSKQAVNARWEKVNEINGDAILELYGNDTAALPSQKPETRNQKVSKYKYEGQVIRLTEKDHARWKNVYHAIPDFDAQLQSADDWMRGQEEKQKKKWFTIVSGMLSNKHGKYLAEKNKPEKVLYPRGRGML